jgi:hypothetical protein
MYELIDLFESMNLKCFIGAYRDVHGASHVPTNGTEQTISPQLLYSIQYFHITTMSRHQVQQLAQKFANTVLLDTNQKFKRQRVRLEQFAYDLRLKLGMLVREMEHDIGLLRERGFSKDMHKMYIKLWNDVIGIYKKLDMEKPYSAAEEFLAYAKNKHVRDVIDNLEFLAEHHLKKTNVDFRPSPTMEQPQLRSIKLFKRLTQHLETYLKNNPLLPVPVATPSTSVDIPLLNVKPEPAPLAGQTDKTIPGVPSAKKEAPAFNPFSD